MPENQVKTELFLSGFREKGEEVGTPCCEVVGTAGFPAPPGERASPVNLCAGRRVIHVEPGNRPDHRPWDPGRASGAQYGAPCRPPPPSPPPPLTVGADHTGVLIVSAVALHPAQG